MAKIYAELARIQRDLKAPKNLYNSFGKYNYRNAEGILESVKPLLNGLALIINDEPVVIGDRYYIKATVSLTDGNETVSATAYAREDAEKKGMDGCQITGSCSSYARKYALNALFMIDDNKDSDDDSQSPKNPENNKDDVKDTKKAPAPKAPKAPDNPGQVTTAPRIPQNAQEKPSNPVNPVLNYLANEKAYMGERLGKNEMEMKIWFAEKVNALVKSGAVKPVAWTEMTMEQAKNLVDAIYKTFLTEGGAE